VQRERTPGHGGLRGPVEQQVVDRDGAAHERVDRAEVGDLARAVEGARERRAAAQRARVEAAVDRRDVVLADADVVPGDAVAPQHVDERRVEGRERDRDGGAAPIGAVVAVLRARGGGRERQCGDGGEQRASHRRLTW
jgi:hypothetical protein